MADYFRVLIETFRQKSWRAFTEKATWSLHARVSCCHIKGIPACARISPWGRQLCSSTGMVTTTPWELTERDLLVTQSHAFVPLSSWTLMTSKPVTFQHLWSVSQTLTLQLQKHRRLWAGPASWGLIRIKKIYIYVSRGLWPPRDDYSHTMAESWLQRDSSLVNWPTVTLGKLRLEMTEWS